MSKLSATHPDKSLGTESNSKRLTKTAAAVFGIFVLDRIIGVLLFAEWLLTFQTSRTAMILIALVLAIGAGPIFAARVKQRGITAITGDFLRFRGRAGRAEFWVKSAVLFVASILLLPLINRIGMSVAGAEGFLFSPYHLLSYGFVAIILAGFGIPLWVRRIRDTGISGWWYLGIMVISTLFAITWVLSFVAGLINLALFLYCGFMPSQKASESGAPTAQPA